VNLPSGWRWESIDDLAAGGVFVDGDWVETKDQDPQGDVRLIQLADVGVAEFRDRSDRWMRTDQAKRLGCTYLLQNDILIARMPEPLGRACMVPAMLGKAATAVDVAILRVRRNDLEPRYLMWALNALGSRQQMMALQSGTTRRRISRRNLGTVRLPIPPHGEQQRIVEILEDQLSRLDSAAASLRKARGRLVAFRTSVVVDALRSPAGATAVAMRFGSVELRIPSSWRVSTVGDEADVVEYGSGAKASPTQSSDAIPVLRMGNVRDGRISWGSLKYLPGDHPDVKKLPLASGDLLFNRTNSAELVGKSAVFGGEREATFASYLIRVRFGRELNPRWASSVINSLYGRAYVESVVSQQVGQANVNGTKLRGFPLPVPPRSIQDEVVDTIAGQDNAARRMSEVVERAGQQLEDVRRSTLVAALAGRLTKRELDDGLQESLSV
jgi:type I restriction enzyme, S subunit